MSLELILGPMFAGKSSAILQIVNRHKSIGHRVMIISHSIDARYSKNNFIVNHDGSKIPCYKTNNLEKYILTEEFAECQIIIIEEGQFFKDLYNFVSKAVDTYKKNVIVVGLDGDADRKPFGQILELIPICDTVEKLTALCATCADGTPALFTYCKKEKNEQVCVGGSDMYMPLCRKHFNLRSKVNSIFV